MLPALHFSAMGVGFALASAIAAAFAAAFLFRKKTELVHLRKDAARAGAALTEEGFNRIPELFQDFAVNDVADLVHSFRAMVKMLLDPKQREAELAGLFARQLASHLKDPAKRAAIVDAVNKAVAAGSVAADPMGAVVQAVAKAA